MESSFIIGLIAFSFFAVSSIIDKYLMRNMNKPFNSVDLSVYKMGFDFTVLFILLIILGIDFSKQDILNGFFIGIIYGVGNILYFRSLQENDVNLIAPIIQGGIVVIVFILGINLFNESFIYYNFFGVISIIFGFFFLYNPKRKNLSLYTIFLVFLTIIIISSHILLANHYIVSSNPISLATFMYLSATITSYSYNSFMKRNPKRFIQVVNLRKVIEVFIGSIFAAVGSYLLYLSFSLGNVSKIYTLSGIQAILILVLSNIFLKEKFTVKRLSGALLILIGILLVYI